MTTTRLVPADHLNYLLVDREHAPEALGTPVHDTASAEAVTQPWALFLGEENDGLVIEGDLDAIADRVDDIARYVCQLQEERR